MAEKKRKQRNTFQKPEVADFHKKEDSGFQKGGNAVFQSRAGNAQKAGQEFEQDKKRNRTQRNQSEFFDVADNVITNKNTSDIVTQSEKNSFIQETEGTLQGKKLSKSHAKKGYQDTFGQNVQKSDTEQGKGETFDFIRNENAFSEQTKSVTKAQTNRASKNRAKKMYQKTFGQNVQKSDTEPEKKEAFDFIKNETVFSEQDFTEQQENIEQKQNFTGQYEKTEPKQSFTEDYHQRDTYRQSAKKKKYHRKRIKKEHQSKQQESKGKDFGEFLVLVYNYGHGKLNIL